MKKHVIYLVLLVSLTALSQQREARPQIGLSIYQDVNLALFKNKNDLTPFTLNYTAKFKWTGYDKTDYGQFVIQGLYTYAELSPQYKGKYYRYAVETGFAFSYLHIGKINFEVTPLMGAGMTQREFIDKDGILSLSLALDVSVRLFDEVRFNFLSSLVNRPDLPESERSEQDPLKWQKNFAVGIEYRFDVYQPKKTPGKASCKNRKRRK